MNRFLDFDLYHVDDLLTDEERMVRNTVSEWVDDRILPGIEQWAWDGEFLAYFLLCLFGALGVALVLGGGSFDLDQLRDGAFQSASLARAAGDVARRNGQQLRLKGDQPALFTQDAKGFPQEWAGQ